MSREKLRVIGIEIPILPARSKLDKLWTFRIAFWIRRPKVVFIRFLM
jgi:hypothetical protein